MKDSERGLTQSGPLLPRASGPAKLTVRITLRTLTAPLTSVTALSSGRTRAQTLPHTRVHQTIQHVKTDSRTAFWRLGGHRNAALAAFNQVRVKQPYGSSEGLHGTTVPPRDGGPPWDKVKRLKVKTGSLGQRLALCIRRKAN